MYGDFQGLEAHAARGYDGNVGPEWVKKLAGECGFELAGVTSAIPTTDAGAFQNWARRGLAGEMTYLTDYRAELRLDPRQLLPSARSIVCVGKLYNGPEPYSTELSSRFSRQDLGWISRYAWGDDYHGLMRAGLKRLAGRMAEAAGPFEHKICADTAPLLERSYARLAGLGWIGKNTCLINQERGSWFFLGELLTSLDLAPDTPPPDRCGTCTRCIDACPTAAIRWSPDSAAWELDARLCISYFTIELRGDVPEENREAMRNHVFGCDICQDVCPWNQRAPVSREIGFAPREFAPPLAKLAALTEEEFAEVFRGSPVRRAKYRGFLRNVAIAMGNSGQPEFRAPLARLAESADELVASHARWALVELGKLK